MLRKLRIYPDTPVFGGCFDEEFEKESKDLIEMAKKGECIRIISDLTLTELRSSPVHVRNVLTQIPEESTEYAYLTETAEALQKEYLQARVVGRSSSNDALHVALATIAQARVIASWNFKHMVQIDKIRGFNLVNAQQGFDWIDIRAPKEIV